MNKLYEYRFELLLFSLIFVLFGSLIVPPVIYQNVVLPIGVQVNILAGLLLTMKKRKKFWVLASILVITLASYLVPSNTKYVGELRLILYFSYYTLVTLEIVAQVWREKFIDAKVILGLVTGYISLGLIGFFILLSIETFQPGSFEFPAGNVLNHDTMVADLMYFNYITLLTIGYGDILPINGLAQKATVLIGLVGQLYHVVVTAIVVGKYINQLNKERQKSD